MPALKASLTPSHLIYHVLDTDRTIDFYRKVFGAEPEDDMEIESPALDAMFGRSGVRIRSTFIDAGGYRLHTIEQLDQPVSPDERLPRYRGLTGLSFSVDDLDAVRKTALAAGLSPTQIFDVELDPAHSARMFFLTDPDGIGCELVQHP